MHRAVRPIDAIGLDAVAGDARGETSRQLRRGGTVVRDGPSLVIGGFAAVATPERLVDEPVRQEWREFVVIAKDTGRPGVGIGEPIGPRLCRTVVVSRLATNPKAQRPLAFERPVSLLVTALAAIETSRPGLVLEERAPGASVAAIPAATAAPLIVPGSVPEMAIGPAGGDG